MTRHKMFLDVHLCDKDDDRVYSRSSKEKVIYPEKAALENEFRTIYLIKELENRDFRLENQACLHDREPILVELLLHHVRPRQQHQPV